MEIYGGNIEAPQWTCSSAKLFAPSAAAAKRMWAGVDAFFWIIFFCSSL